MSADDSRRPPQSKPLATGATRDALEAELPPDLRRLPPEQRAEIVSYAVEIAEQHSGPLPHPRTLADYDDVMPGLAERIVAMAEGDLAHRQEMQRQAFEAEAAERRIGQLSALAITLTALGVSGWIATAGYPATGGILGGATLLGVVSIFVGGREYLLSKLRGSPEPPASQDKRPRRQKR